MPAISRHFYFKEVIDLFHNKINISMTGAKNTSSCGFEPVYLQILLALPESFYCHTFLFYSVCFIVFAVGFKNSI
jgi:uncharacterized membrane protein